MKEGPISKSQEKELKHKSRRLSIKEGIVWSVKASAGDYYVAPFAIAMNVSSSLVAVFNSIWNLGSLSQLFGSKLVEKQKRKTTLTKTMLAESFGWIMMALIGFLYIKGIATDVLPFLILIDLAIILSAAGIGHPSWFSWMGDIIDSKFRGRWFSKRTTIIHFTSIILATAASFLLKKFKAMDQEIIGFIILFSIAFLARLSCIQIIRRQYEPELKIKKEKTYSLKKFLKELKTSNFGKFAIFRLMFAFSIGLTSPLVSIYLLRHLNLDYTAFILIMLSGTMFSILTLNLWGRIADKYGNYKVIALTTLLIPLTPIWWMLSSNPIYLFIVPAIIGGTSWTAFIMASGNFIYDNISKEKRAKAISYFNLLLGIGAFAGGLVSALLLKVIDISWTNPIYLIFFIGAVARMLVVGFWIPKLKEIKNKKKIKGFKEFEHLIAKEMRPTVIEDMHEIAAIPKYIKE